jgi:hypothetical protein
LINGEEMTIILACLVVQVIVEYYKGLLIILKHLMNVAWHRTYSKINEFGHLEQGVVDLTLLDQVVLPWLLG